MSTAKQRGDIASLPPSGESAGDAGSDDTTPLVNALRGGDPAAPAELFDRYGASIHRVLVRIIGSDDPESSDLLHRSEERRGGKECRGRGSPYEYEKE